MEIMILSIGSIRDRDIIKCGRLWSIPLKIDLATNPTNDPLGVAMITNSPNSEITHGSKSSKDWSPGGLWK